VIRAFFPSIQFNLITPATAWEADTFVTNYLPLALFPVMYLGARFIIYKQPIVAASQMDFTTGLAEIEADT
jgi:amino acid transporter